MRAAEPGPWRPDSWRDKRVDQDVVYADEKALAAAEAELRACSPLVFAGEVRDLQVSANSGACCLATPNNGREKRSGKIFILNLRLYFSWAHARTRSFETHLPVKFSFPV